MSSKEHARKAELGYRVRTISVRVSEAEYKKITRMVDRSGLALSEFARLSMLAQDGQVSLRAVEVQDLFEKWRKG